MLPQIAAFAFVTLFAIYLCRNCAENSAWEEAFGALSTIALERLSPR